MSGIARGWYDLYDWYLEGQYIDATGLADGDYILETHAVPNNSNDIDAPLPDGPEKNALIRNPKPDSFNIPVFSGGKIVERPAHQQTLTRRYIERSIAFIKANSKKPFFLYLAHHAPHVPLFAHHDFERKSPWLAQKDIAGSSGHLRDGKGTTFEGGVRVPPLFLWPGTIKPGVVDQMGAFFDLLPTFARIAGAALPEGRLLDGYDLTPVLTDTGPSPRRRYDIAKEKPDVVAHLKRMGERRRPFPGRRGFR